MQSLKSPYILYNQQSVGSTLHNNLLFITHTAFLICNGYSFHVHPHLSMEISFLAATKYSL